ncbi:hypothetical protein WR25_14035 [Diploscapter pachys]|uniref:Uncharacterized protein n=1 Tax=Diploscapter pachys TaxID=2018661 RepID=A0A2A2K0U1_9BILA|nr:hypothetical protein WR25_14035 [Diploscapter pachys]
MRVGPGHAVRIVGIVDRRGTGEPSEVDHRVLAVARLPRRLHQLATEAAERRQIAVDRAVVAPGAALLLHLRHNLVEGAAHVALLEGAPAEFGRQLPQRRREQPRIPGTVVAQALVSGDPREAANHTTALRDILVPVAGRLDIGDRIVDDVGQTAGVGHEKRCRDFRHVARRRARRRADAGDQRVVQQRRHRITAGYHLRVVAQRHARLCFGPAQQQLHACVTDDPVAKRRAKVPQYVVRDLAAHPVGSAGLQHQNDGAPILLGEVRCMLFEQRDGKVVGTCGQTRGDTIRGRKDAAGAVIHAGLRVVSRRGRYAELIVEAVSEYRHRLARGHVAALHLLDHHARRLPPDRQTCGEATCLGRVSGPQCDGYRTANQIPELVVATLDSRRRADANL